ncbi:hypothetical protein LEP1GSC008_1364 [Leptospira kirschneri serovar Bulgarica str. Nikolaevo]|uniref:Uncharacterized protein n=1 Tax=Leptospira kirschneri serovar Bulgarica str. Nikolaevo TaxID=1240687 RepID=M6F9S8_9LEPT|nr:hypothetical protein LEP1GSC008_1364 [Leptospira kirschneri serovar Bulgarica str. Nikolaevo]
MLQLSISIQYKQIKNYFFNKSNIKTDWTTFETDHLKYI